MINGINVMKRKYLSYYTFTILVFFSTLLIAAHVYSAGDGIRLGQTRVIFNAENNNAKAVIKNSSQQVYLIKSEVMNTPDGNDPKLTKPPFIVTPPMFRLEKESTGTALIVRNGTSKLPTDRESVFYLSLLAIPSVSKAGISGENMTNAQVSVGIRNVIKLFYRPEGLKPAFSEAAEKLVFRQNGNLVQVSNPTPYYLTLAALSFDQKPVNVRDMNPMIAPFSANTYPVAGAVSEVQWSVITDFGDISQAFKAVVTAGVFTNGTQ